MRILLLLLLLAAPAYGEIRSWTIYTEAYTADAELVEVRGNDVYLRIDGKVQRVPLFRFSPDDQHYIVLLQTANVFPGPAAEDRNEINDALPLPAGHAERLPEFAEQSGDATHSLLLVPAQNPNSAAARTATELPPPPANPYRRDGYGRAVPIPATAGAPKNYATQAGATAPDNANPRRLTQQQLQQQQLRQQQQQQAQKQNKAKANSDRSRDDDSRRGLRARRRDSR